MAIAFDLLAQQCAPGVHPTTLQAIVRTESGFNPFAIGVVGGRLVRQPKSLDEAIATANALEAAGWNYSMGLSQVNRGNLERYGLNTAMAFDACSNLRAGAAILSGCYARAAARTGPGQVALLEAFSCYYSGNFARGFRADERGTSYVQRVVSNASQPSTSASVVPPIAVIPAAVRMADPRGRSATRHVQSSEPQEKDSSSKRPSWDAFGAFRQR